MMEGFILFLFYPFRAVGRQLARTLEILFGPEMLGIGVALELVDGAQTLHTLHKALEVLLSGFHPLHLAQRTHSGQHLILSQRFGHDVLAPQVGLHAQDVLAGFCRSAFGYGLKTVGLLYRQVAADEQRLVVEVGVAVGRHDDVVTQSGCLGAGFGSAP